MTPVSAVHPGAPAGRTSVFISYRSRDPDMSLAQEFHQALEVEGYRAFMAGESLRLGDDWARRIDLELEQCDYFLLLLSEQSAVSEMVTEEVRRAKQLRDQTGKPILLPIRVNFPIAAPLNYDLRGYLQRIQQREWRTAEDTPVILAEVLALMQEGAARRSAAAPTAQSEGAPSAAEGLDPPAISEAFAQRESVQMPPLPVAEPELPGGQVDLQENDVMFRSELYRAYFRDRLEG